MRTIFDGLVEEFRAWHLFEQQAGNSARRDLPDLPAMGLPDYGAGRYGADGYGAGDYGDPGYQADPFGTPGHGKAGFGAPGSGAPGYGGPRYDRGPRHGRELGGAAPRPGGPR